MRRTMNADNANKLCGAKTRSGGTCRGRIVRGGRRCRMHGGHLTKLHAGSGNPNWKGGTSRRRYSDSPLLGEDYETALHDPELGKLHDEAALVVSILRRSLAQVAEGYDASAVRSLLQRYETAEAEARAERWQDLRVAIISTHQNDVHVRRAVRQVETLRRISDSLLKREVAAGNSMSRGDAIALGAALLEAVTCNIHDADVIRRIAEHVRQVLGHDVRVH